MRNDAEKIKHYTQFLDEATSSFEATQTCEGTEHISILESIVAGITGSMDELAKKAEKEWHASRALQQCIKRLEELANQAIADRGIYTHFTQQILSVAMQYGSTKAALALNEHVKAREMLDKEFKDYVRGIRDNLVPYQPKELLETASSWKEQTRRKIAEQAPTSATCLFDEETVRVLYSSILRHQLGTLLKFYECPCSRGEDTIIEREGKKYIRLADKEFDAETLSIAEALKLIEKEAIELLPHSQISSQATQSAEETNKSEGKDKPASRAFDMDIVRQGLDLFVDAVLKKPAGKKLGESNRSVEVPEVGYYEVPEYFTWLIDILQEGDARKEQLFKRVVHHNLLPPFAETLVDKEKRKLENHERYSKAYMEHIRQREASVCGNERLEDKGSIRGRLDDRELEENLNLFEHLKERDTPPPTGYELLIKRAKALLSSADGFKIYGISDPHELIVQAVREAALDFLRHPVHYIHEMHTQDGYYIFNKDSPIEIKGYLDALSEALAGQGIDFSKDQATAAKAYEMMNRDTSLDSGRSRAISITLSFLRSVLIRGEEDFRVPNKVKEYNRSYPYYSLHLNPFVQREEIQAIRAYVASLEEKVESTGYLEVIDYKAAYRVMLYELSLIDGSPAPFQLDESDRKHFKRIVKSGKVHDILGALENGVRKNVNKAMEDSHDPHPDAYVEQAVDYFEFGSLKEQAARLTFRALIERTEHNMYFYPEFGPSVLYTNVAKEGYTKAMEFAKRFGLKDEADYVAAQLEKHKLVE